MDHSIGQLKDERNPATDYGEFVLSVLPKMREATSTSERINQTLLRQCIGLASSYLLTDTTMNPHGTSTWFVGFSRLVDIVVALDAKNELELETFNATARACSECWSVSGSWRGLDNCRDGVRKIAMKLKKLLDENGRTYHGESVYAP